MKGGGSFGGRSSGSPYGGKYISAQKTLCLSLLGISYVSIWTGFCFCAGGYGSGSGSGGYGGRRF